VIGVSFLVFVRGDRVHLVAWVDLLDGVAFLFVDEQVLLVTAELQGRGVLFLCILGFSKELLF
jgi:hypothetical protein